MRTSEVLSWLLQLHAKDSHEYTCLMSCLSIHMHRPAGNSSGCSTELPANKHKVWDNILGLPPISCSRSSSCDGNELGSTGPSCMRFAKSTITACICISVNGRTCTSFTRLCPLAVPCKLLAEERVLAVMTTGMHNNLLSPSSLAALLRNVTKCDRACCSQEGSCEVGAGLAAPACNEMHSVNPWCLF